MRTVFSASDSTSIAVSSRQRSADSRQRMRIEAQHRVQSMSQQTVDAWDRIAPGYDRTNTPTQMWLGQEGLRRAAVRAGTRFLDVAAGSGALSIPAARLGAQVLATNQSRVML